MNIVHRFHVFWTNEQHQFKTGGCGRVVLLDQLRDKLKDVAAHLMNKRRGHLCT